MRVSIAVALPVLLLALGAAGCTPRIPVKDGFGTSALAPSGGTPPEFAEFNRYDPRVNLLLADQVCAMPYMPLKEKSFAATPGRIAQQESRCQTHLPLLGP